VFSPFFFFIQNSVKPALVDLTYFASIGLGFLIFEIVLMQRFVLFLGFPTYSLSIVLFALLGFTGIGSFITTYCKQLRRIIAVDLAITALLIGISAFGLQPFLCNLIDLPFSARVIVSIILIVPFEVALGMAMPTGLKRFGDLYPAGISYAFGENGIASVLASVLSIAVAINFGFVVTTFWLAVVMSLLLGMSWSVDGQQNRNYSVMSKMTAIRSSCQKRN